MPVLSALQSESIWVGIFNPRSQLFQVISDVIECILAANFIYAKNKNT